MFVILIIIFFSFDAFATNFCVVKDIMKVKNKNIECINKDLIFGYLKFYTTSRNLEYITDKEKNIKIVKSYHTQINEFIDKFCYIDSSLKVKEIINFRKEKEKFETILIISCKIS